MVLRKQPPRLFIILLIWIIQSSIVCAIRPVNVSIISPFTKTNLTGNLMESLADWTTLFSSLPTIPADSCLAVVYPRESILPVLFRSGTEACDILLVTKDNQIAGVIEQAVADRAYAIPRPIISVVLLPSGYCERNSICVGCYVDIHGVTLIPREPRRSQVNEIEQTRADLQRNLERFPNDDTVRDDLGLFDLGTQSASTALPIFEDLVSRNPSADRLFYLAASLANLGRLDEASSMAYRAIEMEYQHIKSYQLLHKISHYSKTDRDVIGFMHSMLDRHPDFLDLRLELARISIDSSDWDVAEELLTFSTTRPDEAARRYRLRGDLLLRRGEYRAAAESYAEFLKICPLDTHASDLRVFITIHLRGPMKDST